MTIEETRRAADDARYNWAKELVAEFGENAGHMAYTAHGAGIPGSALRKAYDDHVIAQNAWIAEVAK